MLDPQLQTLLELRRAAGTPELCDLPPMAARGLYQTLTGAFDLSPADVAWENRLIEGPASKLPIRIYTPEGTGTKAVALYLHGGGFVVGDADCYHAVCSHLCQRSDCIVVSVNYRLAPEHPFPAAVDDAYAALEWLAANAASLGGDPQRMAVLGDSAGANLAAVMTLLARDRGGPQIRCQALIYPVTAESVGEFPSYAQFGEGYALSTRVAANWMWQYFRGGRAPDFRGAPLMATDLSALPPALVQVAGHDPLRDEGLAYAKRLMQAGVPVMLADYPTLSHGYINMAGRLPAANLAIDQIASALHRYLGNPPNA